MWSKPFTPSGGSGLVFVSFLRFAVVAGFIVYQLATVLRSAPTHKLLPGVRSLDKSLSKIINGINAGSGFVTHEVQRFSSGSIPMYYINLDRSTERRRYMESTFASAGKLTRVPAVDATAADFGSAFGVDLEDNDTRLAFCEEQGALCGEVALSASHYRAIKHAWDENARVALIMEDDTSALLAPFWTKTLEEVVEEAYETDPQWKIIRLQYTMDEVVGQRAHRVWVANPTGGFLKWHNSIYGTVAYLINRTAMEHIARQMSPSDGDELFDCTRRLASSGCQSDHWLYKEFPESEVLLRVPPMFTVRLHEDNTGVRAGLKKGNDWRATFHEQSVADSVRMCLNHVNFWRHARESLCLLEKGKKSESMWRKTLSKLAVLLYRQLPRWKVQE